MIEIQNITYCAHLNCDLNLHMLSRKVTNAKFNLNNTMILRIKP